MNFNDLGRQYDRIKQQIDVNIADVIRSNTFILGSKVEELEKALADYVGVKYAITCGSGTDALQLIYMAYGIGEGDVVFCPDMTFIASIEPACLLGATPVFCDIDSVSYNLDPSSLERQIEAVLLEGKKMPKAIVAVDLFGNPADYDELRKIADKYNLLLIEDAAQSMGASYKGKKCGSLGDIAATSFFPSKPLGCYGDGGAVFTNDSDIAELIYSYRVHGKGRSKYDNIRIGINSRLDAIQAAVLLPKLEILDEEIAMRQEKARKYDVSLSDAFSTPTISNGNTSAYAQYNIVTKDGDIRTRLENALKENGIPVARYYPNPMHLLPVFENCSNYSEDYYNTIRYASNSFAVPFSAYISDEEQSSVISVIKHNNV